jgi:hypothetical protein
MANDLGWSRPRRLLLCAERSTSNRAVWNADSGVGPVGATARRVTVEELPSAGDVHELPSRKMRTNFGGIDTAQDTTPRLPDGGRPEVGLRLARAVPFQQAG